MSENQILIFLQKSIDSTIFDTKWCPFQSKFFAVGCNSNANGTINLFELFEENLNLVKSTKTAAAIRCSTLNTSESLIIGDACGDVSMV